MRLTLGLSAIEGGSSTALGLSLVGVEWRCLLDFLEAFLEGTGSVTPPSIIYKM